MLSKYTPYTNKNEEEYFLFTLLGRVKTGAKNFCRESGNIHPHLKCNLRLGIDLQIYFPSTQKMHV